MERFIDCDFKIGSIDKTTFKIQYGEIYSLIARNCIINFSYLKSSMERFIESNSSGYCQHNEI